MKKLICLSMVLLSLAFSTFGAAKAGQKIIDPSKGKPMEVKQTEWGLEISNLDKKGKTICSGNLIIYNSFSSCFFILLGKDEVFDIYELAKKVFNEKTNDNPNTIYILLNNNLLTTNNPNLANYDKILVVPYDSSITEYYAFSYKQDLYFYLTNSKNDLTSLKKIVTTMQDEEKKAEENKRLEKERIAKEADEKRIAEFKEKGGEGYDNLLWGTHITDFLALYPNAKDVTNDKLKDSKYSIYGIEIEKDLNQYYYFYNDGLYYGETIFRNITNTDKINAITERLKELYGSASSVDEFSENKSANVLGTSVNYKEEGWRGKWNKSSTFIIEEELTTRYGINTYSKTAKENTTAMQLLVNSSLCDVVIKYSNPLIEKEVSKYIEDYDKQLEANKIQKEKENLHF